MQTELSQRKYDGKWELNALMPDPTQNIKDWQGNELNFPIRWVTIAVYDQLVEIE